MKMLKVDSKSIPNSTFNLSSFQKQARLEAAAKKKEEKQAANAAKKQTAETVEVKLEKLTLDASLPEAKTVKIREIAEFDGKRVRVCGYIHRLRQQSKNLNSQKVNFILIL